MKKTILSLFFLKLLNFVNAQQFDVYIKNVNIIPLTKDTVLENKCVGIAKNKIVYIGNDLKNANKKLIDGKGKFLMPSINDMHVHWPDTEPNKFLQLCLAAGITKIRVMNSKPEALTHLSKNKNILLPNLNVGFPIYDKSIIDSVHIAKLVDSVKKQGYQFIKIFSIQKPNYFTELVKQAAKNNLPLCGHALSNVPYQTVLNSGYKSVEHVGYLDRMKEGKLDTALNLFAKNKTFICPTLDWEMMVYHSYPSDSLHNRMGYNEGVTLYKTHWDTTYANNSHSIPDSLKKQYANFMANRVANKIEVLKKAHQKGVSIIAGSDAEEPYQTPGYTLIDELLWIQKAGLSNYDLLKTATINAANYFKEQNQYGTVEKGKVASLLLLAKNPLEDIKNLQTVETILFSNSIINKKELLNSIK